MIGVTPKRLSLWAEQSDDSNVRKLWKLYRDQNKVVMRFLEKFLSQDDVIYSLRMLREDLLEENAKLKLQISSLQHELRMQAKSHEQWKERQ